MLLVSGRFCDSKTIIPEAQEHFLTLQHAATLILSVDWGLARGQLAWLTEADDYFRKDIMIPLGAVTMVFIFMLQLERKPKVELSFGTFQAVAAVTIALVSSGVINLSFSELWVAAGIILSPAIVYLGTERISCCFLDP